MSSFNSPKLYIDWLQVTTLVGGGSSGGDIGDPTIGVWNPIVGIEATDSIANAVYKLESKTVLLFPQPPPNLSTITIVLNGTTYSANRSDGALVPNVNTNVQNSTSAVAINTTPAFYNGDAGTLTAITKFTGAPASITGSRTILPSVSNVGTYGTLNIITNADTVVPAGFYRSITANINSLTPLTASNSTQYSMQLSHSTTGSTNTILFYQDDSISPSVSAQTITGFTGSPSYVSGVPWLGIASAISVQFTVTNAVRQHYHLTAVGIISGAEISTTGQLPPAIYRTVNSNPIFTISGNILPNVFNQNVQITCTGQSAAGQTASAIAMGTLPLRVDSKSIARNESSIRVTSGVGDYPASGYNLAYNSTQLLTLNQEAQLIGGVFKYPPSVDYTSTIPAGPNYLNVTTTPPNTHRWLTINLGVQSLTLLVLTFPNSTNISAGVSSWKLQVKLIGGTSTQWVDGNAAYPGVGNPGAGLVDGDPALVLFNSNIPSPTAVKTITFGNIFYTNVTPIVRIGFPVGSNITVSDIQATYF